MAPSSSPSNHLFIPISLLTTLYYLPKASAYTWTFQNTPQQCSNLTLSISGSGGVPPYSVLILPFGPSPLANNIEARKILDVAFASTATSVTFPMNYPANSQFVAVVSDSQTFGSGGTSVAAQVTSSSDASCFNSTQSVSPDFVFSIDPPNQIVQCQATRIWWDPTTVQGTPNFLGVIPGGQSFSIPENSITQVPSEGTGFTWTPSLRGGTTLIIVGGDNRGNGTAGSSLNVVSSGINNNGTCLSDSSPSSTPGSPAGGSYPTGTGTSRATTGGGGSSNVGAIVGGVIGGLVVLIVVILLLLFFRRRQKNRKRIKERPVDLINADDDDGDDHPANGNGRPRTNELPQYYQPEPFMVPDPTLDGSLTDDPELRRPMSGATSTSFYTRATTPDQASGSMTGSGNGYGAGARKGAPRPMRAINIIQHDDAGPSVPAADKEGEDEPETIELPPAYTAVGRAGAAAPAGDAAAAASAPVAQPATS